MNQERFTAQHFPYVPLLLQIGRQSLSVEAMLDTGFDGDVTLPPGSFVEETLISIPMRWQLADGSQFDSFGYLGTVQIDRFSPYPAVIALVGTIALLGRGITDQLSVHLDHGRRIVIEP